jgi:predicted outer membrane protein
MWRLLKWSGAWSLAVVVAATAVSLAQEKAQSRGAPADQRDATKRVPLADRQLAAWLITDNKAEIALAELAQEKCQSDEVRQFAKRMMEEHSAYLAELIPFADPEAKSATEKSKDKQRDNNVRNAADDREPVANSSSQDQINIVRLKGELGERILQSTTEELASKEGAEFDKCYMAQQAAAHIEMVDTLQVFKEHASPELQEVIQKGLETAEAHLDHAKSLAQKTDVSARSK